MKISIVVPCYNEEDHIRECIKSLENQTIGRENLEIIIVNDASTDNSWSVLLEMEKKYPDNILLINCEQNGKLGTARNIGVSYATGDYLIFVDADDLVVPEAMETLYNKLIETDVDIVECEHCEFYDKDKEKILPILSGEKNILEVFTHEPLLPEGLYDMSTVEKRKYYLRIWDERSRAWGLMFKKSFYDEAGLRFPENVFMEDCFFGELLMTECRKLYHIERPLYLYYKNLTGGIIHGDNMKKNYMYKHFSFLLLVEELKKRGTFPTYKDELSHYYFMNVLIQLTHYMQYAFESFPVTNYNEMKNYMLSTFPDYLSVPFLTEDEKGLYRSVFKDTLS